MWEVSNMQKTEQKTEQQAGLGMSFCEEEGRITVFRKTLEDVLQAICDFSLSENGMGQRVPI